MNNQQETSVGLGSFAAEQLSPAYPRRAVWGTASRLRAWQADALDQYFSSEPQDFLVNATPGAGKTTFALRLASELLQRKTVRQVIVVAPTEHLKTQWAEAAARVNIHINPKFENKDRHFGRSFQGAAVTYAQVAASPWILRNIVELEESLVILDEIHHGGDNLSWGDAIRDAFESAERRLSLTGTPFRSDTAPIPFVNYELDGAGVRTSKPDYTYGYGRALEDGVVRPVIFMSYTGTMRWRTKMGEEFSARLGDGSLKDITAHAWRTALDPQGNWIPAVLRAAHQRLMEVRKSIPDAGGLVIATDQTVAREYARILTGITGRTPVLVLSDDPGSGGRISEFAASDAPWMVAVRMVSEGVDVPRLLVGVYATSAATPLYFAQAIGRFVRARRRGETASVFLPSVPVLVGLANELELERDHALDRRPGDDDDLELNPEEALVAEANRTESASDELLDESAFLHAEAEFDRALFDGAEYGLGGDVGSAEELDFLGLPGLLEPDQVQHLLQQRQARQLRRATRTRKRSNELVESLPAAQARELADDFMHDRMSGLRKKLASMVSAYAATTGLPHAQVHSSLRRQCGGPAVAHASIRQLEFRVETIQRWLSEKPS